MLTALILGFAIAAILGIFGIITLKALLIIVATLSLCLIMLVGLVIISDPTVMRAIPTNPKQRRLKRRRKAK